MRINQSQPTVPGQRRAVGQPTNPLEFPVRTLRRVEVDAAREWGVFFGSPVGSPGDGYITKTFIQRRYTRRLVTQASFMIGNPAQHESVVSARWDSTTTCNRENAIKRLQAWLRAIHTRLHRFIYHRQRNEHKPPPSHLEILPTRQNLHLVPVIVSSSSSADPHHHHDRPCFLGCCSSPLVPKIRCTAITTGCRSHGHGYGWRRPRCQPPGRDGRHSRPRVQGPPEPRPAQTTFADAAAAARCQRCSCPTWGWPRRGARSGWGGAVRVQDAALDRRLRHDASAVDRRHEPTGEAVVASRVLNEAVVPVVSELD